MKEGTNDLGFSEAEKLVSLLNKPLQPPISSDELRQLIVDKRNLANHNLKYNQTVQLETSSKEDGETEFPSIDTPRERPAWD